MTVTPETTVPEAMESKKMELEQLQRIIEGALLAADKALTPQQLAELFDESERPETAQIREALEAIEAACAGRGFELKQVASGYRFQVVQDVAPWVGRLWEEKPQRYSRAMLETLALIAYRQPITRGDIEEIRGVAVSSHIIKTLSEREWIRVVGHKDVPGRPAMYATTRKFLDYFNLRNLDELPTLADIKDLDSLTGELAFSEGEAATEVAAMPGSGADAEASAAEESAAASVTGAEAPDAPATGEPDSQEPQQLEPEHTDLAALESDAAEAESPEPACQNGGDDDDEDVDEGAPEDDKAPQPQSEAVIEADMDVIAETGADTDADTEIQSDADPVLAS